MNCYKCRSNRWGENYVCLEHRGAHKNLGTYVDREEKRRIKQMIEWDMLAKQVNEYIMRKYA